MKLENKIGKRINIDLRNWSLWRIIRMVFAVVFLIAGMKENDAMLIIGGAFLFVHGLLSICENCAVGDCEIPNKE